MAIPHRLNSHAYRSECAGRCDGRGRCRGVHGWQGMGQGRVELAAVRHLPDCLGRKHVRFAGRVVVMGATPDQGAIYALGGGTLCG